jgi:transketolase
LNIVAAIRNVYGEELVKLGKRNENIVVFDADVSHSTKTDNFGNRFPDRFFNFGIAEANMVSAAAGMATMGKIPFVNTFSFLLCERALDQIRSSVAYNNLNVKFAANYGGLSDSFDGPSHHTISDLTIIRSIPNMTLIVISDAVCMKKALEPIAEWNGPVYFRLCRAETPTVHGDNYQFTVGKGVLVKDGGDLTIIATGIMLDRALKASEVLKEEGIHARVIEIHTIKPIDKAIILKAADETNAILVCEEANILGGLGSAVAEVVSRDNPVFLDFIGINDCYAESGQYEDLLDKYGMSGDEIVKRARLLHNKKIHQ